MPKQSVLLPHPKIKKIGILAPKTPLASETELQSCSEVTGLYFFFVVSSL